MSKNCKKKVPRIGQKSLTRFFRKRSILKDLLVREGRVEGIASAKLSGSVAVEAETSALGIDLQHKLVMCEKELIHLRN